MAGRTSIPGEASLAPLGSLSSVGFFVERVRLPASSPMVALKRTSGTQKVRIWTISETFGKRMRRSILIGRTYASTEKVRGTNFICSARLYSLYCFFLCHLKGLPVLYEIDQQPHVHQNIHPARLSLRRPDLPKDPVSEVVLSHFLRMRRPIFPQQGWNVADVEHQRLKRLPETQPFPRRL